MSSRYVRTHERYMIHWVWIFFKENQMTLIFMIAVGLSFHSILDFLFSFHTFLITTFSLSMFYYSIADNFKLLYYLRRVLEANSVPNSWTFLCLSRFRERIRRIQLSCAVSSYLAPRQDNSIAMHNFVPNIQSSLPSQSSSSQSTSLI